MIAIEAGVLARAMKNAAAVTESRNTIPILSNVRLQADGDTLEIVTSDLDVEYRERLPLADGGQLATTADSKRLAAVASAAGKGSQLKLELAEGRLTVRNGRSRWQMPVLPVDDFPQLPFESDTVELRFTGSDLSALLARVLWSVSTEQTRYYLHGPLLHGHDGKTTLAATNGHTLAQQISELDHPHGAADVILGPKWCRIVEALSRDADAVKLEWNAGKVRATVGETVLTGKVIDGTFPDYRRVIPPVSEAPVTVDPASLRAGVGKAIVLASDKTRIVKVERQAGTLLLTCTSPETGTGSADVPAECESGFVSGFDARYLDQMLAAIGGDSITIHHADGGAPARFERVAKDGFTGVVMPCRV